MFGGSPRWLIASALPMPPLPWWHWTAISPQSRPSLPGQGFGGFVRNSIRWRLLTGILSIPPSQSGHDLDQTDIAGLWAIWGVAVGVGNHDLRYRSPIAVALVTDNFNISVEDQVRHTRLGLLTKRLLLLRCVDPSNTDLVLFPVCI